MKIEKDGIIYEHVNGPQDDMRSYRVVMEDFKPDYGLADIGRSAVSGATMGWADEMAGLVHGAAALSPGGQSPLEAYTNARNSYRIAQDQFRQAHPVAATASEIGGGLGLGLAAGLRTAGTSAAQQMAQWPVIQRMMAAGGIGAGTGALTGAGEAQTMSEIPEQAATGAKFGLVAGPAVEMGVSGSQALARQFKPNSAASRALKRAAKAGEDTISQVRRKIKLLGPEATLADVNEGFRLELDKLVNRPGRTRTQAIRQLTARSKNQMDEILNVTGRGRYFEVLDQLKTAREQAAGPFYDSAYAKGVTHNDELEELFQGINKSIPGAWKRAKKLAEMDAIGKGNPVPDLGDARPTLKGWQYMKEVLDRAEGKSLAANDKVTAGKIGPIRRRLLFELDGQNPDYAAARNIWSGVRQFEDAMAEGFDFMKPGMTAGKLESHLKDMTSTDRLAYKEGARQAIQDTLERAGFTHDSAKYFQNTAMQKKIKLLFGAKEGRKIIRSITASSKKQNTFNTATRNSATAYREAAQKADDMQTEVIGAIRDAASQGPQQAGMNIFNRLLNRVPTSRESTRDLVGQMLLETEPAKQAAILDMLAGQPLPPVRGAGLITPALLGMGGGLLSNQP